MKFRKIVTPAALLLAVSLFGAVQGPSGSAGTLADTVAITDPGPPAWTEGVPASLSSAGSGMPDYRAACTTHPAPGQATCLSLIRTDVRPSITAQPSASPYAAYGPPNFQAAYNLPSSSAGSGQTVAIVDAYNDPDAASNLAYYRSYYGLPAANLQVVNEYGQTSPLPAGAGSTGWASEESLDLDMVSATCPECNILLVEADSPDFSDLGTGVDTAVSMGAGYVSNSYGGPEYLGETSDDAYYDHPGVAVTVSAGDSGYGVEYPAASQYVTAVGGTSLSPAPNARGWTETVWGSPGGGEGTGSGCSAYESKPAWQSDPCANRTVVDVAADADPNTGAYVYDTYDQAGWAIFGGTSEASPIIASVYALAADVAPGDLPSSYPYADANRATDLNDVTSGSNGSCSPAYLCNGEPGYNGPTGLGTPNGVGAFRVPGGGGDHVTVTDPGNQVTPLSSPVSLQIPATSSGGYPLSYSASGLPPGLSVDNSSGLISGTVSTAGTYPVTVTATDTQGGYGEDTFGWTVTQQPDAVSVTNPGNQSTYLGVLVSLQIHATSSEGLPRTYSATGLPPGLSISSSGLITGAAGGPAGSHTASVTVSDGTASGSTTFTWTVKAAAVVYSGTIRLTKMGYCLDDRNNSRSNGAVVQVWRCWGGPSQVWQVMSDGTIRHNGLCLDAPGTGNGTKVVLAACTPGAPLGADQQWNTRNGRVNYTNPSAVGKVLNDSGYGGNDTQQVLWSNTGTINEIWAT